MLRQRSETMSTPSLFACADKVKIPQIGSEETVQSLELKLQRTPLAPLPITTRASLHKQKSYLQKISSDLVFEEDVIKDRCFHMLPYDQKYLSEALDPSDLIPLPPRSKMPPGRHNARNTDLRHMPCNLTISKKPHLKPIKRKIMERAQQLQRESLQKAAVLEQLKEEGQDQSSSFFLTELNVGKQTPRGKDKLDTFSTGPLPKLVEETKETKSEIETLQSKSLKGVSEDVGKKVATKESVSKEQVVDHPLPPSPTKSLSSEKSEKKRIVELPQQKKLQPEDYDWDGFVLSNLSYNTASWLVYEKMQTVEDKERVQMMMEEWYGKPDPGIMFREEYAEAMASKKDSENDEAILPKKKWKKQEASLLAKVYKTDDTKPHANDPYSERNDAPFYRQPAGLRRVKKIAQKEDAVSALRGAINKTANIIVKTYTPPPLPTIRDFVNPEIGQNLYETDNDFEQEWLTGAEQIHELNGDTNRIRMNTNNKYKKQLQPEYPPLPEKWYPETEEEKEEQKVTPRLKKVTKGLKRWKDLPEPDKDAEEKIVPPGYDPEFHRSPDPMTRRATKNNQALVQVIDEWRSKWHLTGQLADSTPDDLIKDMADIQAHVRLKAIATITKAAQMQKMNEDLDILTPLDNQFNFPLGVGKMPEKLFVALECLLEDSVQRVQIMAAITLFSLDRPSETAKEILHEAMRGDNSVDRWAAAQCLAHSGVCNSLVIGEIIHQLLNTEDTIKHERGIYMLGKLSIFSPLVHGMVAEQLNSSSWRHKVIACKILPTLHGTINKDITNKLIDLMWNDWHDDVKKSAAQCLGKSSHGREVHDVLRAKLNHPEEMVRLEAINKTGQLGIMTAKLLPAFLKCFEDEYVSVRSEVCITCGNLEIKDENVIEKLINLATFDPVWKVKAHAIQALGKIGIVTEEIEEMLLWAVRYEENQGVRAEACHTIMLLELKTTAVADVLQERFLVEPSQVVRDEIANTLVMFGISATEDMDMVAQIKNEVRKLCTRNNIATQITLNEKDEIKKENLARLIYESQKELEENEPEPEPMMQRIRSISQASSRTSTPHPKILVEKESDHETPRQSREGTLFTPTADEEVEKILALDEAAKPDDSSRTSPVTNASTPGPKSGKTTEAESESQRTSPDPRSSKMSRTSEGATSASQSFIGTSDKEESESGDKGERSASVVKFANNLKVNDIPARDQRSTLSPTKSGFDDKQMSRLSSMGHSSEIRAFSRDAIKEREKIDQEARNGFAGFDARYFDMIDGLEIIDNTFDTLLNEGKPKEERIQKVTVITDTALALTSTGDESIDVEDEEEVEDEPPLVDVASNKKTESEHAVDMFPSKKDSDQPSRDKPADAEAKSGAVDTQTVDAGDTASTNVQHTSN